MKTFKLITTKIIDLGKSKTNHIILSKEYISKEPFCFLGNNGLETGIHYFTKNTP